MVYLKILIIHGIFLNPCTIELMISFHFYMKEIYLLRQYKRIFLPKYFNFHQVKTIKYFLEY